MPVHTKVALLMIFTGPAAVLVGYLLTSAGYEMGVSSSSLALSPSFGSAWWDIEYSAAGWR